MSDTYFKLSVKMNDDDLRDSDQVAELLMSLAGKISAQMMGEPGEKSPVRDANGNRVGEVRFDDYPDYRVGDVDDTKGGCYEGYYDSDGDEMWSCTREGGHSGIHAAGNGSTIIAVWED